MMAYDVLRLNRPALASLGVTRSQALPDVLSASGFPALLLMPLNMGQIMPEAAYLRKDALAPRIQAGSAAME
jgi:hypothetical protein